MNNPRKNPHIYEINLMTWLYELSKKSQRRIDLRNIPDGEWEYLKGIGMDFVWLMGIWQRSPYSSERAREEPHLVGECRSILDDFKMEDIVGSPYAVYEYRPDPAFGSLQDLLSLEKKLKAKGLGLILDFVPNHTACDCHLIEESPDFYVQGPRNGAGGCGPGFFEVESRLGRICVAHGKDPYFPPWTDTAQLNYSRKEVRVEMSRVLTDIASMCHGLRCDMAMLVMADVFQKTWPGIFDGEPNMNDFWPEAIARLRSSNRVCLLLAEAYWGKESELIQQGFDYAYDKAFYDLMVRKDVAGLRGYLSAPVGNQEKSLRFLENHDEPRCVTTFGRPLVECVMVMHATLPGARLWQHGQLEGSQIRSPVQIRRAPEEHLDYRLKAFSENLLKQVNHSIFHEGFWALFETSGWRDNQSHQKILAWGWRLEGERCMVVINFSSSPVQGYVKLPPGWIPRNGPLTFRDPLKEEVFIRSADEVDGKGLYVSLEAGDFHFFWLE